MANNNTEIEWTDTTWNPVTGCTKISDGCKNCYAFRIAKRLHAMGNRRYKNCFQVTMHHDLVAQPFQWKKPRMVFVNSMSDLFHEDIPLFFIMEVFETMNRAKQHTFQILTKRSSRLKELADHLQWTENIWMGVTIESCRYMHRADNLRATPAKVKFLSIEPMISSLNDIDLSGIDWVIAGGGSGPGARFIKKEWAQEIRDKCVHEQIPFFFKQWGGTQKKKTGKILDGKIWAQFPQNNPHQVAAQAY